MPRKLNLVDQFLHQRWTIQVARRNSTAATVRNVIRTRLAIPKDAPACVGSMEQEEVEACLL